MVTTQAFQCLTCGHKTMTRTAVGHTDYQEFAFPCGGCGVEMRYGMKLLLEKRLARIFARAKKLGEIWADREMRRVAKMRNIVLANLKNAKSCKYSSAVSDVITVDGETLNPIAKHHFSPFMATVWLPKDREQFALHQRMRHASAVKFGPQIQKLVVHFERKQWKLFDKQLNELELGITAKTDSDRAGALFHAAELNALVFRPANDKYVQQIKQRIALAESTSPNHVADLVKFFQFKKKDEAIVRQLWSIRERLGKYYDFLSPIYHCYYWDEKAHTLDHYTLAQKRFEELKPFFQDCFETFCRISVIAAGLEGIIVKNSVGVPLAKRVMPLEEFDVSTNGSKPANLKGLVIGNIFAPLIDNKLRNGIGHHASHYDVKSDTVHYVTENDKGIKRFEISYIRFCEKIVALYAQLETVSPYAHWVRKAAFR
jgi:hypothetical protein